MKGIAELKSLRDIRTALSTRSRSASWHKGTPYLEILSLGLDKLRLSSEQTRLAERVERVDALLKEIRIALGDRLTMVAEESPQGSNAPAGVAGEQRPSSGNPTGLRGWKKMTVEY